jgi:hypothetical protein
MILVVPELRAVTDGDGDALRRRASQLEDQGQWEKACEVYERILARDRRAGEIREHYQVCLRRAQLVRRHRDPLFREQVLGQDLGVALRVYGEVLTKVRANYVDRERTDPTRLFQQGLEELRLAIEDSTFRHEQLGDVPQATTQVVAADLTARWGNMAVHSVHEAQEQAAEVALAAHQALGLRPVVTVLEFACGACAGLDEYSSYLTPAQLGAVQGSLNGPSVAALQVEMLNAQLGIGYCRLSAFHKSTAVELDNALAALKLQGMKGLILDLRGNPGGLLESAVAVAERFLPDGVVVATQSQVASFSRTYRASSPDAFMLPLVILVDGETASAAEIVAGALKDHQRATLVGQPTFGKGSIQRVLKLEAVPSGIRLTLARFFSPSGHAYSEGVVPHLTIVRPPWALSDPQLEVAVQEVTRLVAVRQ